MIKVLYVNGGIMDRGGVSVSMMNYFRNIDPDEVHIDFIVHGKDEGVYDSEIISRGSKIFRVVPKSQHYFQNIREIKRILKEGKYDIVHSQADSGNAHILKIAKQCGVRVRISHSHNTAYTLNAESLKNKLRLLVNNHQIKKIPKVATYMCGCSEVAFKWLHGNNRTPINIICNGIDIPKFAFKKEVRQRIRTQFGIEFECVFGCVGRLDYQKNYGFLLDVINGYKKQGNNFKLMIIGDGILEHKLKRQITDLKLNEDVILTGAVDNPQDYYSAFDVFLMPSLFEGLGIAAIEAQCNGLSCLLSEAIPKECKLNSNTKFVPLNKTSWVEAMSQVNIERTDTLSDTYYEYDIKVNATKLMKLYKDLVYGTVNDTK